MEGMTPRQAFFIGIMFAAAIYYAIWMIASFVKYRKDCDVVGHKYCKLDYKQPIFYEVQNPGSPYEFLHLYCYCKRCGKKIEYPFMIHKETEENRLVMDIAGYPNYKKEGVET